MSTPRSTRYERAPEPPEQFSAPVVRAAPLWQPAAKAAPAAMAHLVPAVAMAAP
jgi:hypothetical protein